MKFQVVLVAAVALTAGPAMAEGRFALSRDPITGAAGHAGTPSASSPPRSYGVPSATPAPAYRGSTTAKIYSPPATAKPEAFKPYQPYKPASVYGADAKKKRY